MGGAEAPKNGEDSESDRRGDRFGCFDRNLPHLPRISLRAEGGNQTRPTPLHLVLRNKPKKTRWCSSQAPRPPSAARSPTTSSGRTAGSSSARETSTSWSNSSRSSSRRPDPPDEHRAQMFGDPRCV